MNKFLLYITVLILSAQCFAQPVADTLNTEQKAAKMVASPVIPASPEYSNRNFKPGFKDKYTDDEFIYQTKSMPKTWWDRFLEWLGNLFKSNSKADNEIDWLAITIRILCFIVIGFVVYLVSRAILDKEGMWIFGRSRKKIAIQSVEAENIHEMDFKQLISETKINANYRLALRYYYLWLLKKLSAREIIDWHWDKTNSDYLYEIKDAALKKDFEYLSYVYDHSWYGDFPIDEKAFNKAEKSFIKTFNTL
ncbi:DUF4129 domain-containing protein [Flavobacterium sp. Sd200]|uniref:DUF4129 domain-containing protein n=1 Tax=Flavobacterium sp. Sd200 TaxID=2692211 RepID=UPI00136DED7A|nr:DUF4129 domain-containing protein [Flavobacterium sp. Sd200]MXN90435.1 DUF4129 domain-containing protein [Flavobacterium sp. Sd200]